MSKKQVPVPNQDENEDQVKLKPIMGIRPGVYLTVLYSLILLAAFFLFLIQPGIKNPTAALIVNTEPMGAAIRVNDVYMGVSNSKIIIPAGTFTIKAVMPGFEEISAVHEIPARIFGSLFFPRVYEVELKLETTDPAAAFALYARDFATWSFGGEPTETWQIPLSLSQGAYRVGKYNNEELQQILIAALRFANTRVALRDLIRAKMLLDNNGNSPSPLAIIGSISDILVFLSENPGSAEWLTRVLPSNTASIIRESEWFNNEDEKQTEFFPSFEAVPGLSRFQLAGVNFTRMNAGRLLKRGHYSSHRPLGNIVDINSFLISDFPVPISLFRTFLNERPEWTEHYTEYFPDEIAVSPGFNPGENITGITWYAADAFCKWLTERLPVSMAGMEVRLPTEDEWEYASLSIRDMQNTNWEWCTDPFAPLNFISATKKTVQAVGSPERSIKRARDDHLQRASLPPEISSPFVTFRLVIR